MSEVIMAIFCIIGGVATLFGAIAFFVWYFDKISKIEKILDKVKYLSTMEAIRQQIDNKVETKNGKK